MWECETCTAEFYTERSCDQHMNAKDHWAPRHDCESCSKRFFSQRAATQHMNDTGHWAPKIPCETCSSMFRTQTAADQHMKEYSHYKNCCHDCGTWFTNENNLRMHLNSKVHRGTIACPFCGSGYTGATGLAHHLEKGSCPQAPNLNRETILRMVQKLDSQHIITKKQIEWHEEQDVTYSATNQAWNGSDWECYICHREFSSIHGLNQHLNSPVHKQKVYHCPNLKVRCGKEFATLAALFNHLESEACGMTRFERVQQHMTSVLSGQRLIAF